MSIVRLGCVLAAPLTLCALVACSSDDSGTTSSSSSSSGSSGSSSGNTSSSSSSSSGDPANDKCAIPYGKYTISYTTKPGGTGIGGGACQDIPSQETEIKEGAGDAGAVEGDAGTAGPPEGCTIETDSATCSNTMKCEISNGGYTTTTSTVSSTKDGKVSGSFSSKTVKDDDKSVISDCAYDFEWTKK